METAVTVWAGQSIPSPTPQLAQSLSPEQLADHREKIASDVEIILDGYWDRRPPDHIKAGILADWADTLEDWHHEQVVYALRKWRDEKPDKKPNPGHILGILKLERGKAEVARAALVMESPKADEPRDFSPETVERRRLVSEELLGSVNRMEGRS